MPATSTTNDLSPLRREPKAEEGEQTIEHEQFVAERVAEEVTAEAVEGIAQKGGDDADVGHQTVGGTTTGEESEGKESEQGAVGVADKDVDGIDEGGGVGVTEEQDEEDEEEAHEEVSPFAKSFITGPTADVDTVAGGERGEGGVGTGEGGGKNAKDEEVGKEWRGVGIGSALYESG